MRLHLIAASLTTLLALSTFGQLPALAQSGGGGGGGGGGSSSGGSTGGSAGSSSAGTGGGTAAGASTSNPAGSNAPAQIRPGNAPATANNPTTRQVSPTSPTVRSDQVQQQNRPASRGVPGAPAQPALPSDRGTTGVGTGESGVNLPSGGRAKGGAGGGSSRSEAGPGSYQDCVNNWDSSLHMTKQHWRGVCKRTHPDG